MAYILGFLFADGSIPRSRRGNHYLSIQISDRAILKFIKKELRARQVIAERRSKTGKLYRIQIGSRMLCASLQAKGFIGNKTARMRMPSVPKRYRTAFVLGYFDGDGNVWAGTIHKERTRTSPGLLVSFTSVSKGFLTDIHGILRSLGLLGGSLFKTQKNAWRLNYGKYDALKLAKYMYNSGTDFCLKRKQRVFDKFMRP